jgi:alkaline phosphatase
LGCFPCGEERYIGGCFFDVNTFFEKNALFVTFFLYCEWEFTKTHIKQWLNITRRFIMQTTPRRFKRNFWLLSACFSVLLTQACKKINQSAEDSLTASSPSSQIAEKKQAKNLILFIGDGMGISTITAGRIFDGQSLGKNGEEHSLAFEGFENLALIKTYNVDAQVPDSAGTATAIMSGYKARIGTLNVPPDDLTAGCGDRPAPPTLAKRAAAKGLAVGVISTARITHATPAAVFSHSPSRDWEADKDIKGIAAEAACRSIAAQLVDPAAPVNLALGGGRKEISDEQLNIWGNSGEDHLVIETGTALKSLSPSDSQDVLGLFSRSHMAYEADRSATDEPSLAEMTRFAIKNLSARGSGYVLMVEAGRIDHAHHGGNAYRALRDVQALNDAVKTAIEMSGSDTTLLVTADHSHVFTIAGYPKRGNPILGLVTPPQSLEQLLNDEEGDGPVLAKDEQPYTTLGYHNGGGPRRLKGAAPLTDNIVQAPNFRQQVAIPLGSETHAGEDVALYAAGPGAHLVRGVMEQNEIADVINAALGLE